jgi:hypothetical protein
MTGEKRNKNKNRKPDIYANMIGNNAASCADCPAGKPYTWQSFGKGKLLTHKVLVKQK